MELTENDTYRISEGIDFPEVILPDYYNGKKVTEIGNGAFSECKSMKTLVIGNCVTAIGANAFGECTLLTDVVLPDSVTDVGKYAFASCTNLVSVTIGRQVAHIGYYAFSECEKLVEVINNSALKIEKGIDDDDLGRVGYYALDVRAGEKSAIDRRDGCLFYRHGDTVYLLGYTGDRTALTLPDDYDGSAYEIYKFAFYRCDTLESVIIGNSVKRIGEEAFYHCDNLRVVGIPDQITDIGEDAFYNCPITEATLPSCAISAISVKKLETVVITSGDIEKEAFYYAENLTSVTLGNGVKTIGTYAFAGSKKLKTLIIKDKVTEIGASAFSDCVISDIYITDIAMWCRISGVENLMESGSEKTLYLNGEAITDLVIPDGITAIGTSTFYGVKNLISVTVPTSVISIGEFAFRNCNNLKSITLPFVGASRTAKNGYDQVFGYIFGYRTTSSGVGSAGTTNQYKGYYYYIPSSIRTVIISDGATAVAEKAFYRCGNLVNVVLPDSIETIGTSAFEYCDNLESIRLPFLGASRTADNGYDQVFGYIFGYTALDQQNSAMTWTYQQYYNGKYYYANDGAWETYSDFRCMTRDAKPINVLSYAYPEVRKMMVDNILKTLPDEWDGVSLYFHRGLFVSFEKPVLDEVKKRFCIDARRLPRKDERLQEIHCSFITEFVRELSVALKEKADKVGHERYKINIVTLYSAAISKEFGCDVETLLKEKLIDSVSQGIMGHYETIEDCIEEDGLIDLNKYSAKKKCGYTIIRNFADDVDIIVDGAKEFLDIQKKYGGEFYAALGWENRSYSYQCELSKKLYEIGVEKFISWNANHQAKFCARIQGIKTCGDKQRILDGSYKISQRTFRLTNINGSDISEFDPNWRG